MNTHLFLLSTHGSGSTALRSAFVRCKNVVKLDVLEGSFLWSDKKRWHLGASEASENVFRNIGDSPAFNPERYNWGEIKKLYRDSWERNIDGRTGDLIYFDKSPAIGVRLAKGLEENFENSYFLIVPRNPYATVESCIRNGAKADLRVDTLGSISHWVYMMKMMRQHFYEREAALIVSYEFIADNPEEAGNKIKEFVPGLDDLEIKDCLSHGPKPIFCWNPEKFRDINPDNISRLSGEQISMISSYLKDYPDLMEFWGYDVL